LANYSKSGVGLASSQASNLSGQNVKCEYLFLPQAQERYEALTAGGAVISDAIEAQLTDLMKCKHPGVREAAKLQELVKEHLGATPLQQYGVWVYYPWSHRLVHLLGEAEYALVRTNRNKHKITAAEQALLETKKIGIIGLSVGQSVALTLALERGFQELRLADFDTLDLSNLNRLRAGVHELGLNKAVIAARQIAELDPFLKVTCFTEGITDDNLDVFFTGGGQLDLLIEECDGLEMKIKSREKARALKIPVLMDTSDRGMLDIERFDLEPDRPLLHGLLGDLGAEQLPQLSPAERMQTVLQMAGGDKISDRGKASLPEIGKTISTWPQLGSAVTLGGGAAADTARRILLGQIKQSGRFYVDLARIISDEENL